MPSSIGHGLAAVAAGWMVVRPATSGRGLLMQAGTFAVLGAAPDLDLLIGRHNGETHSLGAAAIVATAAAIARWPIDPGRARLWLAAFLAWATHPLLDALAPDTKVPIGVMAFWPISVDYYNTGWDVFLPISRACCSVRMVLHDTRAMLREAAILAPVVAAVWWWRYDRARRHVVPSSSP